MANLSKRVAISVSVKKQTSANKKQITPNKKQIVAILKVAISAASPRNSKIIVMPISSALKVSNAINTLAYAPGYGYGFAGYWREQKHRSNSQSNHVGDGGEVGSEVHAAI